MISRLTTNTRPNLDVMVTGAFGEVVFSTAAVRFVEEHVLGVVLGERKETEALKVFSVTHSSLETQLTTRHIHITLCPATKIYRLESM